MTDTYKILTEQEQTEIKNKVIDLLEDNKAEDIKIFDLRGKSSIAEYMIIASGKSKRHIMSIAENTVLSLKKQELLDEKSFDDGKGEGNWIVFEVHGIIVHLFRPEAREYYDLESLWQTKLNSIKKELG